MTSGNRPLFFLLFCALFISAFPDRGSGESSRIVGSEKGRTYHFFCLDSGAPYIFRDAEGVLSGMYVDILASLGSREGLKLSLSFGDGREARRNVHLGKIDAVAGSLYPTPSDSELFGYLPVKNLAPENSNLSS
ncbi:MAG: transporter substrate-binding domain-containing protein, partial [Synergistales bacterium]|nr:transporter substrate-binding domain-containing protein [Synergistales bacterium]